SATLPEAAPMNERHDRVVDDRRPTGSPAVSDLAGRVHRPGDLHKVSPDLSECQLLSVLELRVVTAEELLGVHAVDGREQIRQDVVDALGQGDERRLVVHEVDSVYETPEGAPGGVGRWLGSVDGQIVVVGEWFGPATQLGGEVVEGNDSAP